MNLQAVANSVITAVNPQTPALLEFSTGSIEQPDGGRVPTYHKPGLPVLVQVQPLSYRDIQQIEGLNLQGERVAIYVNGEVNGLIRARNKGGDLITISDPASPYRGKYLTAIVSEQWGDWVKFIATLQNDPAASDCA